MEAVSRPPGGPMPPSSRGQRLFTAVWRVNTWPVNTSLPVVSRLFLLLRQFPQIRKLEGFKGPESSSPPRPPCCSLGQDVRFGGQTTAAARGEAESSLSSAGAAKEKEEVKTWVEEEKLLVQTVPSVSWTFSWETTA